MIKQISVKSSSFASDLSEAVSSDGVAVVQGLFDRDELEGYRRAILSGLQDVKAEIGDFRLKRAGEIGVVRAPMKRYPTLLKLLSDAGLRRIAFQILGNGVICHLMNGLVVPPQDSQILGVFQGKFHRDFPRFLNGYLASLNTFVCLDDFSAQNGATRFLLRSHQSNCTFSEEDLQSAISAETSKGSVIVFDSTVLHAAGNNRTHMERIGINIQWTKSFIKQQIDLVRYIGLTQCATLPEDVQASIGMHSRVVTSLEEYYVPSEERLYRADQG